MNKYEKIAKWIISQDVNKPLKDSDIKEVADYVFDTKLTPTGIKYVKDELLKRNYTNIKDAKFKDKESLDYLELYNNVKNESIKVYKIYEYVNKLCSEDNDEEHSCFPKRQTEAIIIKNNFCFIGGSNSQGGYYFVNDNFMTHLINNKSNFVDSYIKIPIKNILENTKYREIPFSEYFKNCDIKGKNSWWFKKLLRLMNGKLTKLYDSKYIKEDRIGFKYIVYLNGEPYYTAKSYDEAMIVESQLYSASDSEEDFQSYYGSYPNVEIKKVRDSKFKDSYKSESIKDLYDEGIYVEDIHDILDRVYPEYVNTESLDDVPDKIWDKVYDALEKRLRERYEENPNDVLTKAIETFNLGDSKFKDTDDEEDDDYEEEIVSKTIYLDRYDSLDSYVEECLRNGNLKMRRSRGKNKYVITGTEDAIEWFVKRLQQTSDTYIVDCKFKDTDILDETKKEIEDALGTEVEITFMGDSGTEFEVDSTNMSRDKIRKAFKNDKDIKEINIEYLKGRRKYSVQLYYGDWKELRDSKKLYWDLEYDRAVDEEYIKKLYNKMINLKYIDPNKKSYEEFKESAFDEITEDKKAHYGIEDSKLPRNQKLWYGEELEKVVDPKFLRRNYQNKRLKTRKLRRRKRK